MRRVLVRIVAQNVDMEAPSPYGDDAVAVIEFVNKLSAALAKEGVQTSYCIGGMNGNLPLAKALNQTAMRTVPMSLYGSFNANWEAEVAYWKASGMAGKLGVGFCPTCNEPNGEVPSQIASKVRAPAADNCLPRGYSRRHDRLARVMTDRTQFAAAADFDEIDMFAFGAGAEQPFKPYCPRPPGAVKRP
jgi:hypothetical protein